MKNRRLTRFVLLISATGILLIGGGTLLVQARQRQYSLDRRLIAALVKNDSREARDLVDHGADPNTPYDPPSQPTLRHLWNYLFHHSTPQVSNYNPSAFLIACGEFLKGGTTRWPNPTDAPQLVETMLCHGAQVNMKDGFKLTPLHWAVWSHHLGTVGVLIAHGADVNANARNGVTPLMYVSDGPPAIVRMLIEHGANVNARDDDGVTPLSANLPNMRLDGVRLLIEKGADVNAHDKYGETPLIKASEYGSSPIAIVRVLIKHGANVNAGNNDGETALIAAAPDGNPRVVRLLLEHGANINSRDKVGNTALTAAVPSAGPNVVRLLLEYRAEVNARNKSGDTALIEAVSEPNYDVSTVRLLLAHGAHPNVRNKGGMTVLQLAKESKYAAAVTLLQRAGAKK
jgi:ankyrin repeat protein